MNRVATTLSIAVAFAAGCGVTHLLRPALAAEPLTAQIIHTGELEGDALSPANPAGMRNKMFVNADGTGTIWLGDKEVRVKPGDLVIIPHGTAHGGTKPDGRTFKAIAIKTPPQTPDDVKLLN